MRCPFCSHIELKVTDSRSYQDLNTIKRRRECLKCQNRFTTFETVDLTLQVKKRDGTYEDFYQKKLIKGLDAACCHSKISHDQVRALVSKITADLMSKQIRIISTKDLGEIVMKHLQNVDMVAYIRFACVYRRFKDIGEVVEAIQSLSN
jgi:transcriptional repressor NrdR